MLFIIIIFLISFLRINARDKSDARAKRLITDVI